MSTKWLPRYMTNPYYLDPELEAGVVTKKWLEQRALLYLREIFSQCYSNVDTHGGAYSGLAGIAYAMLRASFHFEDNKFELLKFGNRILKQHYNEARKNQVIKETSYLLGVLGIYVVIIIYENKNDLGMKLLERFIKLCYLVAKKDVLGKGDDELLAGRAGFLAAIYTIRQHLGHAAIPDDCARAVVEKIIHSGRAYAASKDFGVPLMYKYHDRHYLGAAHGVMGIMQIFDQYLDGQAKSDVLRTVDWLLSLQLKNGNFPSKLEEKDIDRGENELVHWCHGATGAVHLMVVAYLRTEEYKYLEVCQSAKAALNLIWQKGILLKGPGICHGASGSGYAFLLFYRLTKEKHYLDCALCIARSFCSDNFKQRARTPDRPYSLFEGISGSLCFLCDLLEPDKAQFPFNPYLVNSRDVADKVTERVLKVEAAKLAKEIMEKKHTKDEFDGGPYVGIAGDGYSIFYATRLLPEKQVEFASFCTKTRRDEGGFYLLGTLGVKVIKAILDYEWSGSVNLLLLKEISSLIDIICADHYLPRGADEMLVGRAGFLAAISTLRMRLHRKIVPDSRVRKIINCIIDSGRKYAQLNSSPTPLMYEYYDVEYLGAAHGLMGILQMLLNFFPLLEQSAVNDIENTLNWLLEIQAENGNFAVDVKEIGIDHGSNDLVHWCHGASGAVPLMILAYLHFKNVKFLQAAEKALNLIWERGVLRKGPGICHGVAGSGYAFLLYYRLTQNTKYLDYARCFAMIACNQEFRKNARQPDRPYSLFEGIGGLLCFLVDVCSPMTAQFPLVPIKFD
ncbi:unnamed protein product [Thelazia callipaeda]|uniref:LanC-like protein 3 n=1 Tax=Thelazia callipaeda TaxID=103827 RepID=A0A0N5D9B6_THECL|nr:unnamed protein product [Thelazia callipaeda]